MTDKTIIVAPLDLVIGTSTELETIPLNTKGVVTAITIIPLGTFADMFIGAEISYPVQKGTITKIRGYLKQSIPLQWQGRVPVDTESDIIIEHLNASGATIRITVTVVIELE